MHPINALTTAYACSTRRICPVACLVDRRQFVNGGQIAAMEIARGLEEPTWATHLPGRT